MRFVCIDPTGSGDVVWERRAAPAAAADSAAAEGDLLRNAALAAIEADELGGGPRGSGGCELARLRANKGILTPETCKTSIDDV